MKEFQKQVFKMEFEGKPLSLEISEIGCRAEKAVLGRFGDTVVLSTLIIDREEQESNFFPLNVEYQERYYAAGKIIGSRFIRRETRPADQAVLSARLIDRAIRPLFNQRIRFPIQIVNTILSYEEEVEAEFIALLATSLAISLSKISWAGPVAGAVFKDSDFKVNAFLAGTDKEINMIELESKEAPPSLLLKIFVQSQEKIKTLINFQKEIIDKSEASTKSIKTKEDDETPLEFKKKALCFLEEKLEKAVYTSVSKKESPITALKKELFDFCNELCSEKKDKFAIWADEIFEQEINRIIHQNILEKEKRPDGRKLDEIRPLYAEVGLLPRTHGSALFTRGETQSLSITTLAPPGSEQLVETMEISEKKHFLHHYNFPPYSVGEIGLFRAPSRREIGHGALVEKSLKNLIPCLDDFSYTIRVVSEILSSNGSSSMASVCSSSLALMDAGVPLERPVVGIAMGLIMEHGTWNMKQETKGSKIQDPRFKILTDIQGPEDHHGDMDFKITGTEKGITAIQMDVKIKGINKEIFEQTLKQAQKAHQQILELIKKVLPAPRKQISPYAPVVLSLKIDPEKIGKVIGSGGKTIQNIVRLSGEETTIDIEDEGKVFISALSWEQAKKAKGLVEDIVKEYKIGDIVEGQVKKILSSGAIIDLNGQEAFVHISELKNGYVAKVEDVLKKDQMIKAKVIRQENDRLFLSLKNSSIIYNK